MKFASREGATARTLAVTAPGWYSSAMAEHRGSAQTHRAAAQTPSRQAGAAAVGQLADLNSYSRAISITFNRGQEIFRRGDGE
jgi:hypothetical protein